MISIIDYGMGNSNSVKKALDFLNIKSEITSSIKTIKLADKILLPGVGAYSDAVDALHNLNIFDELKEKVLIKKTPILGICLGMQLLANSSEESKDKKGLSFIDTSCKKFTCDLKVPHVGWNDIDILKTDSPLFKNIPNHSDFYFVHSYHFDTNINEKSTIVEYGYKFTSSYEKDNIFGLQFHPEKSQKYGLEILKNFGNL